MKGISLSPDTGNLNVPHTSTGPSRPSDEELKVATTGCEVDGGAGVFRGELVDTDEDGGSMQFPTCSRLSVSLQGN